VGLAVISAVESVGTLGSCRYPWDTKTVSSREGDSCSNHGSQRARSRAFCAALLDLSGKFTVSGQAYGRMGDAPCRPAQAMATGDMEGSGQA
jgi:hypothetical protein